MKNERLPSVGEIKQVIEDKCNWFDWNMECGPINSWQERSPTGEIILVVKACDPAHHPRALDVYKAFIAGNYDRIEVRPSRKNELDGPFVSALREAWLERFGPFTDVQTSEAEKAQLHESYNPDSDDELKGYYSKFLGKDIE